ncbi:complement C3-like isoform X2 [Mugil cephalus]|uniref:complement C3-like isoform X2 n=1 Tax=Mugil cephalus TaxID=48193 RepID=UPI001FB5AA85|nr:complement C3-like isoform X2 [Mugil cephalus]
MRRTVLLLAFLAFASLNSLADGAQAKVMSAPNLLRVGTPENIFVECQGCTGGDIPVEISVWRHPTKSKRLTFTSVTLTGNGDEDFQKLAQITIPPGEFSKDPSVKQYVNLEAKFPDRVLEKVVLVTFQSGYIFIQTDKTLYTPNAKVHYRMFALAPGMEPVEAADASISVEVVTPDGIILPEGTVFPKSGIHTEQYLLPEASSPGLWKIVAKFTSNPQQSFSAEFEVKEYVLPSFEIKLTTPVPFFYVDSEDLTVSIHATYLFGEEVDGTAYVVFGIIDEGQKRSMSSSLQRVSIEKGKGEATLKKEHITQTFNYTNILPLVGSSIFVSVSVLTESDSELVEAELRGIQIVTSPYRIVFKKTPKYFKPGMSFDVVVEVLNPDDTPAKNVPVVVNPGAVPSSTADNGMARVTINTQATDAILTITAKTNKPRIGSDRQANATMVAFPQRSTSYIHIGVDAAQLKLGDPLKVNLNRQINEDADITYLILSRGQLLKYGRHKARGQVLISVSMTVTKEMLPSFRIVAYYHSSTNHVVSDSVWVDVEDSCMGQLKLEPKRPVPSYEPRRTFGLKVTGDPGATVGLVAVDKGVYVLNNKHRLTQKKVWDIVEKYDTGCTPGGGKDSMGVFFDAGLVFETSAGFGTPDRIEPKCPAPSRRKRATTLMEVTTTLASKYKDDKLQKECCLDGMKPTPVSYSCEVRSEYIVDGQACIDAFLDCCKQITSQLAEQKEDFLQLARSEEDDSSYLDSNNIVTRTNFPESWLWMDIKLPDCPRQNPECDATFYERDIPLQDSITTWQFTGISLSRTHGICVGDPLEVIVRKDFFIDLKLPYSAVQGEQLEIKAILHNHSPDVFTVRVDLQEEPHLCSAASKRKRFRQEVTVGKFTTRSVPFIIIPMKEGEHKIVVKAAVKDLDVSDGIQKMLRVVPLGVLVKHPQTVTLDPTTKGVGGTQEEILNSAIPKSDVVPNTPSSTQISVTGREQVSTLVENAISGKLIGSLITQPSGCGEQTMAAMTLPVIATIYLDKTNQWETVGFKRRVEALEHIKTGYVNMFKYRKSDGSFAIWEDYESSAWLTAYVAKVFAIAHGVTAATTSMICGAVKFLILKAQQPDGMFSEVGRQTYIGMTGDVRGTDSDASMTAFCLIAMQESRTICSTSVNSLPSSIDKAVAYLERRLPSLTNPYAVAMTSYALANEGKLNKDILYRFASPDRSHWPVPKGHIFTLEATAYVLLALVKTQEFEAAKPVVRWLSQQQSASGQFGSTQATIIAYQAVAEYWANAKEPDYKLNVDVIIPGKSKPDKFHFNRENHYATRTSRLKNINHNITVVANGTGEATVTMVSLYYARPKEMSSHCQKFNLSVELLTEKVKGDETVYRLKIEVLYKDKERDATMSILDIGLLTGFTVNTKDLDLLSKGHAKMIAKYEMNTVLSERGSLVLYLNKVSHKRPEEISFRLHQKMKVAVLQPAAVSVYEYYNQSDCVKFYHPERQEGQLLTLCLHGECACAEEDCTMQKKEGITNDLRTAKVCESTETSKVEFVYKVRLDEFVPELSIDVYKMHVVEVIKEGSFDVGSHGKKRMFLSFQHCRESLGLKQGKTYLVMGSSKDIRRDDKKQTYYYMFGEGTWVEYWPTTEECQTDPSFRTVCLGMEDMVDQYETFACQL